MSTQLVAETTEKQVKPSKIGLKTRRGATKFRDLAIIYVFLYVRVSTAKQVKKDLSIPDQIRQMKEWCKAKGYTVLKTYVEDGLTATDDRRPVFQEMLADAYATESQVNGIVVHSLSRFYRDQAASAICERKLKRHGVRLISITQETPDDATGEMMRGLIGLFDEYQSKETGKHTLRAMNECARQGYFPGSKSPFGYRRVEVNENERKKWRLEIDPDEAEIVRQIFHLSIHGQEGIPFGIKKIAEHFNAKGVSKRGAKWSRTTVGQMLNDTVYVGEYYFNKKCQKEGYIKPQEEWVPLKADAIVSREIFDKSAVLRSERAPTAEAPKANGSSALLTGILKCKCGSRMTIATGKGGKYSYYKCTHRINVSKSTCTNKSIPMEKLDTMVLETLADKVFTPERVLEIVKESKKRLRDSSQGERQKLGQLRRELERLKVAVDQWIDAIGARVIPAHMVKDKILASENQQKMIKHEIAKMEMLINSAEIDVTPEIVTQFCENLRNKLLDRESQFGKAYLNMLIVEIIVDGGKVRITGRNSVLIHVVQKKEADNSFGVPTSGSVWLPEQDSNLRQGD